MKHYPIYHFIHHLTFSTLTITKDVVFLEDATFTHPVNGGKTQTYIGLPHQAFRDILNSESRLRNKENILKMFEEALAQLQPSDSTELKFKLVKLQDFIFRMVDSDQRSADDFKLMKTGYSIDAILILGYGPAYEQQLQLKSEKTTHSRPELRTPGNYHMQMLALRYQFYLHIKIGKRRVLDRTARTESALSDPLIFNTARLAYRMAGPKEAKAPRAESKPTVDDLALG